MYTFCGGNVGGGASNSVQKHYQTYYYGGATVEQYRNKLYITISFFCNSLNRKKRGFTQCPIFSSLFPKSPTTRKVIKRWVRFIRVYIYFLFCLPCGDANKTRGKGQDMLVPRKKGDHIIFQLTKCNKERGKIKPYPSQSISMIAKKTIHMLAVFSSPSERKQFFLLGSG